MHDHGHDHGRGARTLRALLVTLRANLILTALKWIAFMLTGSSALFAEAMHSSADALNPFLNLVGQRRAARDPCETHPQGHARETLFWSLLAAFVMFLVGGCWTAYHAIDALRTGHAPGHSPWALGIMALALVLESRSLVASWRAVGSGALRDALATRDTAALAVLLENAVDVLGVVLALAGFGMYLLTGDPRWDAGFSLLIAVLLTASSLWLVDRNRSLIVGERADAEIAAFVADIIAHRECAEVLAISTTMIDAHTFRVDIRLRWRVAWLERRYAIARSRASDEHPVGWSVRRLAAERQYIEDAIRGHYPDARIINVDAV